MSAQKHRILRSEMKRLTPRFKSWLVYRARKHFRPRRDSRWRWATVATQQGLRLNRVLPQAMPARLCLDRAFGETVGFIAGLRRRTMRMPGPAVQYEMARRRGRRGWLRNYQDFSCLREISPGAALLTAAEYDRARQLTGIPLSVVDLERWDADVYATLQALGFFAILDVQNAPILDLPPGFYIQPLASEMAANSRTAVDQIVDLFGKAGGDEGLRFALCGAVVDALENVKDHAYPQDHYKGVRHVPNWWFTGAADSNTRKMILGIYDQGITIPVSLPRRFGLTEVAVAFARWFNQSFDPDNLTLDGQALDAAMRLSATSTGSPHRGKGLSKIREVVGNCEGGRLRIVSRCGDYKFARGEQTEITTHDVALPGTYVEISASF
jgi:hypothetical protein